MGFGQEMKYFISAAQAGQKMAGAADDAAYQKTKKAYLQAQLETINAKNLDDAGEGGDRKKTLELANIDRVRALTNSSNALAQRYKQLGLTPPVADDTVPNPGTAIPSTTAAPAVPAAPAAPAAPGPVAQIDPAEATAGIPQDVPEMQAAVGGPVKHYAAGGAVDDSSDDEEDDPAEDTRVAAVGPSAPVAPSTAAPGPGFSPAASHDAVAAGLGYEAKHFGMDKVAAIGGSPGHQARAAARRTGAHAAPLADMDKVKKAVDPQGTMSESARNLAAIGAVYQWKMNKGDTEGAARAAYQMIAHYRQAADKYAAIAAVAGQKGNTDVMVHAAMKAYANIPDGKNFDVVKMPDGNLQFSFTDDHGNVIQKGIEPPDKLAAAAMGMMRGGFDRALNDRAGVPNPKEPGPPKGLKVSDKAKLLKGVDDAYETQNPDVPDPNDSKKTNPKYVPDEQTLHKGAAFRMVASPHNDTLTPAEATEFAAKIADPSISDKAGFTPKQVDGGVEVTFGKRKAFVPQDDFDALLAKRTERLDAKKATDKKAEDDAKGGYTVKGAIEGVKSAASAAYDWTKGDLAKAAKKYPEAAARIKSAIEAGGRAASDAKSYIEREAAKPNIFKGIANGPGDGV